MHISRHGAERNQGLSETEVMPHKFSWNAESKSVELTARWVSDFNTNATHHWYISITLDELGAMIDATANALEGADLGYVSEELASSLTSLLRIATACSTHLAPQPPTPKDTLS